MDMKLWPQFHNGVAAGLRIAQGISQVCMAGQGSGQNYYTPIGPTKPKIDGGLSLHPPSASSTSKDGVFIA